MESAAVSKSVKIVLGKAVHDQLKKEGYVLYAFKAVDGPKGGYPVVWFTKENYLENITITWKENYSGYISMSEVGEDKQIEDITPREMQQNQTFLVNQSGEVSIVKDKSKSPYGMTIDNQSNVAYSCGLSQKTSDGSDNTICAFPLHGKNQVAIVPIAKIALMFAGPLKNTGTVIAQAFASGILVDLTAANSMQVKFTMDDGWDTSDEKCSEIKQSDSLVQFLITGAKP